MYTQVKVVYNSGVVRLPWKAIFRKNLNLVLLDDT